MIRTLVTCATVGAAVPVCAGASPIPIPLTSARAVLAVPAPVRVPLRDKAEHAQVRLRSAAPLTAPPARRVSDLEVAPALNAEYLPRTAKPGEGVPSYALVDAATVDGEAVATWGPGLRDVSSTANGGGAYAVRDALHTPIRRHRRSTMVTLRLDGEDESAPVSVGGLSGLLRQITGN
jgi:hypothetical protein